MLIVIADGSRAPAQVALCPAVLSLVRIALLHVPVRPSHINYLAVPVTHFFQFLSATGHSRHTPRMEPRPCIGSHSKVCPRRVISVMTSCIPLIHAPDTRSLIWPLSPPSSTSSSTPRRPRRPTSPPLSLWGVALPTCRPPSRKEWVSSSKAEQRFQRDTGCQKP